MQGTLRLPAGVQGRPAHCAQRETGRHVEALCPGCPRQSPACPFLTSSSSRPSCPLAAAAAAAAAPAACSAPPVPPPPALPRWPPPCPPPPPASCPAGWGAAVSAPLSSSAVSALQRGAPPGTGIMIHSANCLLQQRCHPPNAASWAETALHPCASRIIGARRTYESSCTHGWGSLG